jgi:hypothetical protein
MIADRQRFPWKECILPAVDEYLKKFNRRKEKMVDIATLKKTDFAKYLNDKFEIHTDTLGKVEAQLVEVTGKNYESQESFSVIFRCHKETVFEQKIHKIKHPKMGEIDLFLVPITSEKQDAQFYQAVFSRLVEKK